MCDEFIAQYTTAGWVVYPETFGFDMVAVSPEGERVGIEAKLHPNTLVLDQAIGRPTGAVHFRAVLVPHAPSDFRHVASTLRLSVLELPDDQTPMFYAGNCAYHDPTRGKRWQTDVTEPLLAHPMKMRAGLPAPRSVTKWKVTAVTFCLQNMGRQFTAKQFHEETKLHMGRWEAYDWVVKAGKTSTKRPENLWSLSEAADRPDLQYPELADAIRPTLAPKESQ